MRKLDIYDRLIYGGLAFSAVWFVAVLLVALEPELGVFGFIDRAHATERSTKAVADFKRTHVCPSTGVAKNAPCPGQVVDHIMPLCFGGADSPENMMFMPIAEAKKKDEFEREACALKRKCTAATPAPGAAAK